MSAVSFHQLAGVGRGRSYWHLSQKVTLPMKATRLDYVSVYTGSTRFV